MKQGSTLFFKTAVILMGLPVLTFAIIGVPWLIKNPVNPDYAHILYPIVIGMYVTVIPFFIALYQAFQLLIAIDRSSAFSERSVTALSKIKYSAFTIGIVYVILLPFFYFVAELDDAPGIIVIGMIFVFASIVISVFATVLQKLLKEAIDIKSENDLTV